MLLGNIGLMLHTGDLSMDKIVEKFAVMGSPEARAKKLRWMMDLGVYPVMYPIMRHGHTVDDHFLVAELISKYPGQPTKEVSA